MNNQNDGENKSNDSNKKDEETADLNQSGSPGTTPGAAEGDEETIDEDIREKEAEGKL